MKKIYLSLILVCVSAYVMAQTTPRTMVATEVATGTWCQYCPGAAMGADDLLANGCFVAVMENHNGDPFANQYSNARNSYYGITGYPTAVFDGITGVVGGSHTQSMYTSYLPKYNQRINTPAHIFMTMNITNAGLNYTAVITMTKIGNLTATNLKLRFAVTVSHIQYAWQGQTHLEHVNALMVPDATGTTVDFTSGNTQVVTLNYALDPIWPVEDCEFIAFVQSDAGKEVQQCVKSGAVDLTPGFIASTTEVDKNEQVTFTNQTIGGYIGTPETYQWYFPGATPDTSTQKDPTATYTQCGFHDVRLIVNRGGQIDTLIKVQYIHVGPVVNINAIPNDTTCWSQPITLDATTPNATSYLWQPGGATTPTITVSYPEYGFGSHTFTVTVTSSTGCMTTKSITVFIDACEGINDSKNAYTVSLYPNPNNGNFSVNLNSPVASIVSLKITNILGSTVYEENGLTINGKSQKNLKLNLSSGIYFMILKFGDKQLIQKFFVE